MIVKKLRLQRGWSQEHLAELTGLATRTIQRLERGQKPGLESQKALASAFEVDVSTLTPEDKNMNQLNPSKSHKANITEDEKAALNYVRGVIGFYAHGLSFIVLMIYAAISLGLNSQLFQLIFGSWAVGILFHALNAFELIAPFSAHWERKLIKRRLGRKL